MHFGTRPVPEYSLSRQRRDYQEPPVNAELVSTASAYTVQRQSSLLSRLPLEIRLQIWQYAVGNQTIHIINKYRRLGHAVMDNEYWHQHHAERPSLRAYSWMYTYGSLPTTKQLADNNLCDLLVACRQIYLEALVLLYSTNTFVFWDLRTVAVFERSVPSRHFQTIRAVHVYAMFYRSDDINQQVEARSLLQLEAWPDACAALASMPNLRDISIYLANSHFLDKQYLMGQRSGVHAAVLSFVREVKVKARLKVYLAGVVSKENGGKTRWSLKGISEETVRQLGTQLQEEGVNCVLSSCMQERCTIVLT